LAAKQSPTSRCSYETRGYIPLCLYIYIFFFCFCQILWIMQKFALSAVRLTTAGLSLLKFAPSLPLEFSLCVVHQLNYTASWMELFPAVYYYRQLVAPPVDNISIFSKGEHHGNHSVAEASKWQSIKPKITYFHIFLLLVMSRIHFNSRDMRFITAGCWDVTIVCSICNQIWKYRLVHSYRFHPDDRGSKFHRSVCYSSKIESDISKKTRVLKLIVVRASPSHNQVGTADSIVQLKWE